MSSQVHEDDTPLEDIGQLVQFMAQGGKPVDQWVIGTEHEKLGWWPARSLPPDYHDPRGIGALLESLADTAGWTATREGPAIIALARDRATLTLEPGGQFELSGAPLMQACASASDVEPKARQSAVVVLQPQPGGQPHASQPASAAAAHRGYTEPWSHTPPSEMPACAQPSAVVRLPPSSHRQNRQ